MKREDRDVSWQFAFDADCATCRNVSTIVGSICADSLEVVPLQRADIVALRRRAFGGEAPHTPTLLRREGEAVRAWIGVRLGAVLVRHLGPWRSLRLLRALGEASRPHDEVTSRGRSRRTFLQLGAGAALTAGVLVFGRPPRTMATPARNDALRWAQENEGRLPSTYDDIVALGPERQRLAYTALPSSARSALWSEQLRRFGSTLSDPDAAQISALQQAQAAAEDPRHFMAGQPSGRVHEALEKVRIDLIDAFGERPTQRMVGELVAPDATWTSADPVAPAGTGPECNCAQRSNYCSGLCSNAFCVIPNDKYCGTFLEYLCDGMCTI